MYRVNYAYDLPLSLLSIFWSRCASETLWHVLRGCRVHLLSCVRSCRQFSSSVIIPWCWLSNLRIKIRKVNYKQTPSNRLNSVNALKWSFTVEGKQISSVVTTGPQSPFFQCCAIVLLQAAWLFIPVTNQVKYRNVVATQPQLLIMYLFKPNPFYCLTNLNSQMKGNAVLYTVDSIHQSLIYNAYSAGSQGSWSQFPLNSRWLWVGDRVHLGQVGN